MSKLDFILDILMTIGVLKLDYWLLNRNAEMIENQDRLTGLNGIHKKYLDIGFRMGMPE